MAEYAPGTGPGNLGNFTLDIQNFIRRTNLRLDVVVKKVLFDIFDNLILVTPVDTGYARSCWGAGMEVPELNLARGGPGPYAPPSRPAAIRSFQVREGLIGYIYNNCRYIIPLEYGHSQAQAPRGMARVTLTRFQNYVANAAASTP